ncbi:MAG TPA: glycosyltransferase family 4 protein [Dehalococcoidia bacterium]|jgi:phosphatidylinositol alpha-mannosyltransferase|nr:glycosyltransferase family 4 protein [Dehalococcoidia bacterium]
MKVAQISPYDFAYPGGVTSHICHLSRQLALRGHQIKIIAPCSRGVPSSEIEVIPLGRPIPVPSSGSYARVALSPGLSSQVKSLLAREHFDILHIHEPFTPMLPITVVRLASEPKVGTFHAFHGKPRGYALFKPVLSRWFRRLAACTAVSRPALDFVSRHFPGNYEIIPNGIDLGRFHSEVLPIPELCDGKRNILFVGRPEKRKGLKYLLRAYRELKREFPDLRLLVVGPGTHLRQRYERLAQKYHLEDVVFTGYVSDADLPRYYRSAEVFCAPATGQESFGIVLLEAMAMGTPVVATNIDGYASVMEHGVQGLLVPPRREEALAQAIATLLDNPALGKEMGARGRLTAADYSWKLIARRVEELYLRLLHSHPTQSHLEEEVARQL